MRTLLTLGTLFLLPAALGVAGPVDGQLSVQRQIGAATEEGPTPFEMSMTFQGGKPACVAVAGDHEPVVPLDITVYDKAGKVVAQDESQHDFVAAFWTPPRTAEYRIVIRNYGKLYNKVYIFAK
jgi:hypothetical protein